VKSSDRFNELVGAQFLALREMPLEGVVIKRLKDE
jgi:hypothetical protein